MRNTTSTPIDFTFNSGQRFDFLITGPHTWRWSDGMYFTQAIDTLTLRAGETKTFPVMLSLVDDQSRPRPAGSYRAAAEFLGTADTANWSSQAAVVTAFTITD